MNRLIAKYVLSLLLGLFSSVYLAAQDNNQQLAREFVEIGDEKKEVSKDTLIDSPKGIMHCWYNDSDGLLRFLVIKTPFPKAPTKFLD